MDDFRRIRFSPLPIPQQAVTVPLHLLGRYDEPKVVEQEKLKFELIQLVGWQTADFGVARVGVENICFLQSARTSVWRECAGLTGEEFASDGDASDDQSMDVIAVYSETPA